MYFFAIALSLISCISEQENSTEKENLANELIEAKKELKSELDKKENPITTIMESYKKSNILAKNTNFEENLQFDLENSYLRMSENLKLVGSGKLSNDDFYNDVNGAFQSESGFKTDLGKKISIYYKEKYLQKKAEKGETNSYAYEKFKKIQELKKEIKNYEDE